MTTAYAVAFKETLPETSVAPPPERAVGSGEACAEVLRQRRTRQAPRETSQCVTDFQAKMVAGLLQLLT